MTRLKTEWIDYMLDGMNDYNSSLKAKTGFDLAGLTMDTFGISKEKPSASLFMNFSAAKSATKSASMRTAGQAARPIQPS